MGWPTHFPSRKTIYVLQAAFICILAGSLIFGLTDHETPSSLRPTLGALLPSKALDEPIAKQAEGKLATHTTSTSTTTLAPTATGLRKGNATLLRLAPTYIEAILAPEKSTIDILSCPVPKDSRYQYLREIKLTGSSPQALTKWMYFFALDLTQCAHVLPRLLGSVLQAIKFLGPENCALSIVEGLSTDGTYEILLSLRKALEEVGITYHFTTSDINSSVGHRIVGLAALRNLALQPLFDNADANGPATSDTTIVFINDVFLCAEDILELIHQRQKQKADMVCAMDWFYNPKPQFYDTWTARGMTGDTFFEIPKHGSWDRSWDLLWNDDKARTALKNHRPFQVYSCWNGALTFTAKPFLESGVRFRREHPGECPQGEPKSLCKDFWLNGYGKIAVVPSVNLEYGDEGARKIKRDLGYVSDWVDKEEDEEAMIEWQEKPPEKVKCMPSYRNQTWPAWDEPKGAKGVKREESVHPMASLEEPRHYRSKGVWR